MKVKIVYGKPVRYFIDDVEVSEKEYKRRFKKTGPLAQTLPFMQTSESWPRKSDALGVHPSQKAQAEEQARKAGVPTEYDGKTGQAILRDNAHQRDLMKLYKMRNNHGGYGQITG